MDIKVSAKQSSQNFIGEKEIKVTIQITNIDLNNIITDIDLGIINIPQSIINDNSKTKTLILFYLKSNNKNHNLKTLGVNISDNTINAQSNIGTAKIESSNKKYYNGNVDISFTVSKEKIDLNKLVIDQYSKTNADTSKTMKKIDISKILRIFNEIKLNNPTIEYQNMSGENINDVKQRKGIFKVKIIANSSDPNYKGIIVDSGWQLL